MRVREGNIEPQINAGGIGIFNSEKAKTRLWKLSSELIGVYLWFLQFSNILLKLVQ